MKKTLWLLTFSIFLSCSKENTLKSDFEIEYETIDFRFDSLVLSSQVSYFHNVDYARNRIFVLNPFRYSIDTLNFASGSYLQGKEIDVEGPYSITGFDSFLSDEIQANYYFGSNFYYYLNPLNGLKKKQYGLAGEETIYKVKLGSEFGNCVRCSQTNLLLLFNTLETQEKFYFATPENFDNQKITYLEFKLSDVLSSSKLEFSLSEKSKVVKDSHTYIQEFGDKYLTSWDFQSNIHMLNKNGEIQSTKEFESNLFPNRKVFSPRDQKITNHQDFIAKSAEWNNDVSYGPIYKVPNSDNYFRLIKGKTSHRTKLDGGIFISLFDSELNKVGEKLINTDKPDMGLEYFVLKSGIYIKRVTESEDKLSFYRLTI
ncbi:hypothetical protein [Algoriphagus chordae]|uniref:TolB-like protein n=1 Tax=Algoriphagus chordae TaxID=237019 RepID=A0A2W7QIK9_9BACT|nr:hypothetical protein [Algoriphagus chordae]PZX48438.1 hypothetical protein LV85_03682 [Algoriphagus chordae]